MSTGRALKRYPTRITETECRADGALTEGVESRSKESVRELVWVLVKTMLQVVAKNVSVILERCSTPWADEGFRRLRSGTRGVVLLYSLVAF